MKKLAIIAALFAATQCLAASCWMDTVRQRILWDGRPASVTVNGLTYQSPSDERMAQAGWVQKTYDDCAFEDRVWGWEPEPFVRAMTEQELADREAARAAEQAAAEAAASLPLQSATGFAVQDSDGHWIELEPTGDGLPVIGVQISNSPLTPEERAAMKAERKAAHDALKAASQGKKLNDKDKIALLMKAVFGVD